MLQEEKKKKKEKGGRQLCPVRWEGEKGLQRHFDYYGPNPSAQGKKKKGGKMISFRDLREKKKRGKEGRCSKEAMRQHDRKCRRKRVCKRMKWARHYWAKKREAPARLKEKGERL